MLDKKFWAKYFRVYDILNLLIPYQKLLECVCDELKLQEGIKVLELGCGSGNLAIKIKSRGALVVGLDFSQEALNLFFEKDSLIKTVFADLSKKFPFEKASFDRVVLNNVLYTLPERAWKKILQEIKRVLKDDGLLIITNPKKKSKPFEIFKKGIKENFKKEGLFKTLQLLIKLLIPIIKILQYNRSVMEESEYFFPNQDEYRRIIEQENSFEITSIYDVYVGQNLLISAIKK